MQTVLMKLQWKLEIRMAALIILSATGCAHQSVDLTTKTPGCVMRTTSSSWAILRGHVKADNIDLVNSPDRQAVSINHLEMEAGMLSAK
jgi:hypothetical protein